MTTIELFHKITGAILSNEAKYPEYVVDMILNREPIKYRHAHRLFKFCKEQQLGYGVLFELREYFADVHDIILESEV